MQPHEQPAHGDSQALVRLGRVLAVVAGMEAIYLATRSVAVLLRLSTDYSLWPVTLASAVLWPAVFAGAAYVLWRPRLAESLPEALLRSGPVLLVAIANLLLVLALIDRPDFVLRSVI